MEPGGGRQRAEVLILFRRVVRALAVVAAIAAGVAYARRRATRRWERAVAARLRPGPDGVVPGAAPLVMPCDGAAAVLLIHGFGDTPQTLAGLAAHLHGAGIAVRAPLLPGHGRSLREFSASHAEVWMAHVRDELAELRSAHEHVAIVGLSMGGALATILAEDDADLFALVLIAPYLEMPADVRQLARLHAPWGLFVPWMAARGSEGSIHDPLARTENLSYGCISPRLVRELARIADASFDAVPRVLAPTLIIQSRHDNRVQPATAQRGFDRLVRARTRRLIWAERGGHVITVDEGREQIWGEVEAWLAACRPDLVATRE